MRQSWRVAVIGVCALAVHASALAPELAAQPPQPPVAVAADTTIRPPISAGRAFFTSLVVPGLAQARLRRGTGILFASVEALGLTMYAKSSRDRELAQSFAMDSTPSRYSVDPASGEAMRDSTGALVVAEWVTTRYGTGRVRARKTHVEDWVALLIFNHLIAGADAFVAAHLWDLPARVSVQASPAGTRVSAAFRW
jgi:hypothetical protein